MTTTKKMLHLVNKSPNERSALDSCLRLAAKDSAILLIEDGVYAAISAAKSAEKISSRINDFQFYVLKEDLDVRGLAEKPLIDGVTIVDYNGFVELAATNDSVQSWM